MSKIRLVGIIGIVFGLLFLFYLFLGSTLVPPTLIGAAWWATVFRTMFSAALTGTVIGIAFVVSGLFLLLQPRRKWISWAVLSFMAVLLLIVVALS